MGELKQLLSWLILELERAEARLLYIQEILTATLRERDEAREQLLKLEAEYCNMVTNTQQHVVMSVDRSEWPDTKLAGLDLAVDPYSTTHYDFSSHSPPDQFCWNSTPAHHLDLRPDVDLHRLPTSYSKFDCSNPLELKDQTFYHQNEQQLSLVEQQQSEQQLSLVEQQQSEQQQEVESQLLASPPSILGCTPAAMPAHLPETPEADLEVMQGALPERGKLLQAVMQAGPLLQTLLLTGPLPQWRHPPPVLDSAEIPKISMCSSPNSPLPIGPLVRHVPSPQGPADPLQVNSAASSSHHSLRPRTRINKPPTAALIPSPQSGSAAASSSSKLLFAPVLNSLDSAITRGSTLKFVKMH